MYYKRIGLHGVPRSGTSWVGEVLNSSPNVSYSFQPLFSYGLKHLVGNNSELHEIQDFFDRLLKTNDAFVRQEKHRLEGSLPTFIKGKITHVVYKETQSHEILFNLLRRDESLKVIAIIRNPLSVLNSWFNAPREFRTDHGWKIEEEWRYAPKKNMNKPELFYGYERWKDAAKIFLYLQNAYPDRVFVLNYASLLEDPAVHFAEMFTFIDLDFTEETFCFIEKSSSNNVLDPYSVYRIGQSDDKWKQSLDKSIIDSIQSDLCGTELEQYLS